MNTTLFDQATVRYRTEDYRGALRAYTSCLQDNSVPFSLGEVGLIYHRIGNCLVKLKNPQEAIQAYTQALSDPAYEAKGSLQNNIGMAYASLKDYNKAADHFQLAIDDETYDSVYKAYMGLGNAQLKLGKSAEAGVAFREAALDEANPDPSKALLNLGICFMALDRPDDAVLSYESALQFPMSSDTRNRISASMGQAYVASGKMAEALAAFEAALSDGTYELSDSAEVDYQRALGDVNKAAGSDPSLANTDMSGLDVSAQAPDQTSEGQPFFYDNEVENQAQFPGYMDAYDNTNSTFFETTDAELEQLSKAMAKKDRRNRNVGLKFIIILIVVIVAILGVGVFGYLQGFGWPTQSSVIEQLFDNPEEAEKNVFADGLSSDTVRAMTSSIPADSNIVINGVNMSASESEAYVTLTTAKGGKVMYRILLVRNFIGWQISSVELYFPSLNQ